MTAYLITIHLSSLLIEPILFFRGVGRGEGVGNYVLQRGRRLQGLRGKLLFLVNHSGPSSYPLRDKHVRGILLETALPVTLEKGTGEETSHFTVSLDIETCLCSEIIAAISAQR